MRWMVAGVLGVLAFGGAIPADAGQTPAAAVDLLAFSSGALIERVAAPYSDAWDGLWLLDEDAQTGWANAEGAKPPFELVVSLPEQSRFSRFVFDTQGVEAPAKAAREIDILISDQSAGAGFTRIMSVALGDAADGQGFDVPAGVAATGRWVKFVLKSNHGDEGYLELMNVHGFGVAVSSTPIANVSGTYEGGEYGKFHLLQTGAQLTGCYEFKEGMVQGGLEGHLMRLAWSEEKGAKSGPAVMVATRDGHGFQGLWRLGSEGDSWHANWRLRKLSDAVGGCPHWQPAGANSDPMAGELARTGRVRLYGINFDTDSDRLRADATPSLEQLKAALTANAGWRIMVEGHTDSTSTAAHNLDLSARRAAAVKAYLVKAGVPAARLDVTGFGQDKPVAPNETALGRAQNRRVEVVKE